MEISQQELMDIFEKEKRLRYELTLTKESLAGVKSNLWAERANHSALRGKYAALTEKLEVRTLGDLQRLVDEFKPAGIEVKLNVYTAGIVHLDAKSFTNQQVNNVCVGAGESASDEIRVWIDGETLRVTTPKDTAIEVTTGSPKLSGTFTVNGTLGKVVTGKESCVLSGFQIPSE